MNELAAKVFTGSDSLRHLSAFLTGNSFSQVFVLVDENTRKHCYPKIAPVLPTHSLIQIKSGEKNKTLGACELVWKKLTKQNADRKTLLINLGGGVIGDMGGFAAACYKRGIKFINLPTTLLAMVDASVGSKTGIDFLGFKNQIGLFADPEAVFIHTGFLKTLPEREIRAGLAEVIKHYLIADKKAFHELAELLTIKPGKQFDIRKIDWEPLVQKNIAIKSKIVSKDKFEAGGRKALNFGHTVGHALETYFLNKGIQILHGEAIAIGIIVETRISVYSGLMLRTEFPHVLLLIISVFKDLPGYHPNSIPTILKLMEQDKKNKDGKKQFSLLTRIGNCSVNNSVEDRIIIDSLKYYSEASYSYK